MRDLINSLKTELNDLSSKIQKLEDFLFLKNNKTFTTLSESDKELLKQQYEVMKEYERILKVRIMRAITSLVENL